MGDVRIELDPDGIRDLLASDDVQRMLTEKAERVAVAARAVGVNVGTDDEDPLPIEVTAAGNARRARAVVAINHPAGLAVEAKHRVLGSSLDAAR